MSSPSVRIRNNTGCRAIRAVQITEISRPAVPINNILDSQMERLAGDWLVKVPLVSDLRGDACRNDKLGRSPVDSGETSGNGLLGGELLRRARRLYGCQVQPQAPTATIFYGPR